MKRHIGRRQPLPITSEDAAQTMRRGQAGFHCRQDPGRRPSGFRISDSQPLNGKCVLLIRRQMRSFLAPEGIIPSKIPPTNWSTQRCKEGDEGEVAKADALKGSKHNFCGQSWYCQWKIMLAPSPSSNPVTCLHVTLRLHVEGASPLCYVFQG